MIIESDFHNYHNMTDSRLRIFLLAVLPWLSGHANETQADTRQEMATGMVNLYFSAPLLAERPRDSSSWERHTSLSSYDVSDLTPVIWRSYRTSERKASKDFTETKQLIIGDDKMAFTITKHGKAKPGTKLPVTISLHGGGSIPKDQNDLQWRAQQERYPDAPGIYVCPRAPRDTWNQWHADHVYPLIDELIQKLMIHEEVAPNQIYLMGFSAGGYGAFSIGASMPDRFAAVAASAGAPTPDHTPAEHWRNLPLRFEIGEKDMAYGRVKACRDYEQSLNALRVSEKDDAFKFTFIEHEGAGHQIKDQDCAKWLGQHRRNHRPSSIAWHPTASNVRQFYWLASDEPIPGQQINADINGNKITLNTTDVHRLRLRLDDQLVDLDQPVTVIANGMKIFEGMVERELHCLVKTLEERGDPKMMFCSEIALYIP
ncbi:MAG: poly(3-hydroxybutyrate) depolymerase [Verrucomicrobiales bacterium]